MRRLLLPALLLGLGACSLPTSQVPPATVYRLSVPALSAAPRRPVHLVVDVAYTAPELDTDAIVIELPGHRLDTVAAARWPVSLPRYVQQQLIRAFSRSGAFRQVSDTPVPGAINYRLRLDVLDFRVDETDDPASPTVRVRLHGLLQRLDEIEPGGGVALPAEARQAAGTRRMQAIMAAFDTAFAQAAGRLAAGVMAALPAADGASP